MDVRRVGQQGVHITETKSMQFRMDATNILNHPVPNTPTLGASRLGGITGKGNQVRVVQASLRFKLLASLAP